MYIQGDPAISHAFIGRQGNFSNESISTASSVVLRRYVSLFDKLATVYARFIHREPTTGKI